MPPRPKLTSDALAVLRHLLDLDRRGAGFHVGGVAGWVHRDSLPESMREASVPLGFLASHGWLRRVDATPPGNVRPVWLFRISAAGARLVDPDGVTPAEPGPLGRPLYLPPAEQAFVWALRTAWDEDAGAEGEERGWRTHGELLRLWPDTDESHRSLVRLVERGMAERHAVWRRGPRGQVTALWRVTEAGRLAAPVEWRFGLVS